MKAAVYTEYGPPEILHLTEREKPVPGDQEVMIRVRATSVNYGDIIARNFKSVSPVEFNMFFLFWILAKFAFGYRKPKINILGSVFSGEVDALGRNVTSFTQGDLVFGYLGQNMGAYAEYICIPEKGCITEKPSGISHEEAAANVYGAIMAVNLLQKMKIQPGHKVLINGASGGIGSAAVQIAKYYAAEVTGVCGTDGIGFVKSLGADKLIDYTKEDFRGNGERYDIILDINGRCSFSSCKASLKPEGRIFYASFKVKHLLQMLLTSLAGGKKVKCALASGSREDLNSVKELIESGALKPLIVKSFTLEQIAAAHRFVESGHKKGNVAISME